MKRAGCIVFICFICTLLPIAANAGSRQEADEIVVGFQDTYSLPVDREQVRAVVQGALDAGVPHDEVSVFMEALSTTDRSFEEIRSYLDTISEIHRSGIHSELVLNTILEGIAKSIPREIIEGSLSAYEENLMFCRDLALKHIRKKRADDDRTGLLTDAIFLTLLAGFDRADLTTLSTAVESTHRSSSFFIKTLEVTIALESLGLGKKQVIELMSTTASLDCSAYDLTKIPALYLSELKKGWEKDVLIDRLVEEIERSSREEGTPSRASGESGSSSGGSSSTGGKSGSGKPSGSPGSSHGPGNGLKKQ
jgi:uncharacterized membrane protein YgcG